MKKLIPILVLLTLATIGTAQENWPKQSAASKKYHDFRVAITEPAFGLAKVKKLIKTIKVDQDDNRVMPDSAYNSLTLWEKFTYNCIHGEYMDQNCDANPPIINEEKKLFAYPPSAFDFECTWSERQIRFFNENRKGVINLLRETLKTKKSFGPNLKQIVYNIKGYELIPDLIAHYKTKRYDHDILSLFNLMMHDELDMEFLASPIWKALYSDENNYYSYMDATSANQNAIIALATKFYNSKTK